MMNQCGQLLQPAQAIDRLLSAPHVPGAGNWTGADCWGIVELWYRHVLGIEISDRAGMPPGGASVQVWADTTPQWQRVAAPVDHCIVLMSDGALKAGHVGIYFGVSVLHSASSHGCVYQRITHRLIRAKTTGYLVRT